MKYGININEDLQFRSDDQKLEIIAISGPNASTIMRALIDRRYAEVETKYKIKINRKNAERIVSTYSSIIH